MGNPELTSQARIIQAREKIAKLFLEHQAFSIPELLSSGEEDRLLPNRFTPHRKWAEISQRFREKLDTEYTYKNLREYYRKHERAGLALDLLAQSIKEVIRPE